MIFHANCLVSLLSVFFLLQTCTYAYEVKDGDIIFQESLSSQSRAVQIATNSRYSHVGIIFFSNGKPYVTEAVQPVQSTPLGKWIKKGKGRHFVVKRLKPEVTILTPAKILKMKKTANTFIGKDYDYYFGWKDDLIYCSELVWKIYYRALGVEIAPMRHMKDFQLNHPHVRNLMKKRYGKNLPLDEKVVSPSGLFESNLLEKVVEK